MQLQDLILILFIALGKTKYSVLEKKFFQYVSEGLVCFLLNAVGYANVLISSLLRLCISIWSSI